MDKKVKALQSRQYKLLAEDFGCRLSKALYGTTSVSKKGNMGIQKEFEIKVRENCEVLGKEGASATSGWLSGRQMPSVLVLFTIADVLNVSVDWLLGRTEDKFSHFEASEREKVILEQKRLRYEGLKSKLDEVLNQKSKIVEVEELLQQELELLSKGE